ncbi:MAG: hypothetical protein Q8S54_17325 [Bacteroidota bacterium]|nr:hypothetical protein [Odoribacter sp.]MDP3644931.1 hypothetical protein [Bacteroidota bacterium]
MKHSIFSIKSFFIAFILFAPLTMKQLAAQVKEGSSPIILSGLQMNVTNDVKSNQEQIIAGIQLNMLREN